MMTELFGYVLALITGLLLSLLGGGGSILTVPILVYIFGIEPSLATAYSLLIVGVSSFAGAIFYFKNGNASLKTALFFSFPSFVMVFIMRKYIVPYIPTVIISNDYLILTKHFLIMATFALLMMLASFSMIRGRKKLTENINAITRRINYPLIFTEGIIVGSLTGFVGVGGGFLIIPVLTVFVNLPMKMAIGTSLTIIAINSIIGFLGDLGGKDLDWGFLLFFLAMTLTGVIAGSFFSAKINGDKLKPAFGWFILFTGLLILIREVFF